MYILTEVIGVISEVLIIWLFIQGMFARKSRHNAAFFLSYLGYGCGLTFFSLACGTAYTRIFFCGIGIVMLTYFLYESRLIQAFFTGAAFCAIYMMIDVSIFLLASLLDIDSELIMSHGITRCVNIIKTNILLLVVITILLALTKRKRSAITLPFICILSPGYVISILLGLSFCKYLQTTGEDLPLSFLFASIALLYMNIVLVFYAEQAKLASEREREIEIAEHHYVMQEQYYAQLRSEQNETRAMFHDISKHMQAMRTLVDDNQAELAKDVLAETQLLYDSIGNVVDVGNSIISVILNEYKTKAEDEEITFTFSVSVSENIGISAVDCYIILGNTLDNAIEGALSVSEGNREIHLQLRQHKNTLFYKVENTCSNVHALRRRDKKHGFGLKNVKKCVDKYSGDMTTSMEGEKFIFMARLNLTPYEIKQ